MRATVGFLPPGSKGFDANTPVSPEMARRFVAAGFTFAVRYVRRAAQNPRDVTTGELVGLLEAGLGLMLVQHVALPDWRPGATLGTAYGETAAREARGVGLVKGVTLWCDLEGVAAESHPSDVIGYCNAWYDQVYAAGYQPGLYVGDACGLTATQLYRNLRFKRYWSAYNLNRDVYPAIRGVQMRQKPYPAPAARVPGVPFEYDVDVIQADHFGDVPTLLLPWAP
jgi:hypothetical protein